MGSSEGRSGNPAGRETRAQRQARIDALAAELAQEFGGLAALTACDRVLIGQAAQLLLRRPKGHSDVVRVATCPR
jgi:hypothetical protein